MAKVTKHQAKDGSLHNTARECETHDRKLRIAPAMEKFVNSLPADAPGLGNVEGHPAIALEDLPKFLSEHAEQLRDAINNALVVRRPRKAKKVATPAAPAANDSELKAA